MIFLKDKGMMRTILMWQTGDRDPREKPRREKLVKAEKQKNWENSCSDKGGKWPQTWRISHQEKPLNWTNFRLAERGKCSPCRSTALLVPPHLKCHLRGSLTSWREASSPEARPQEFAPCIVSLLHGKGTPWEGNYTEAQVAQAQPVPLWEARKAAGV